ncbi:MAG: hypothetical protein AAGF12_04725 [Myxococcota bacterium]
MYSHYVAVVGLVALGCGGPAQQLAIVPSLQPVDSARPRVVFPQVRGEACGRDAVAGAIRDLKRVAPVDGFLEVVVEAEGEDNERCARITGYPFRYGTDPNPPGVQTSEPTSPRLVPGRDTVGPSPSSCSSDCARIAPLIADGTTAQALAQDRCEQRCETAAFVACIAAATTAAEANLCLDAP